MHLKEGYLLQNGKYRIIRVLGQGGFGITYLAMDKRLGRLVAIKEFFPKEICIRDSSDSVTISTQANEQIFDRLRKRFVKEARNLACLSHPNIVRIFEDFEENGTAYYVMEYIEGENLNLFVKNNGPVSELKARKYICQIGDAVDCIHAHQMTHFDIKPANIMLRTSDDSPILVDFGLSKDFGNGEFTTMLQAVSNGYSPMELYNVSSIQGLSPESDIYSLAATMYYLVTGKVPPYAADLRDEPQLLTFHTNISESTRNAITQVMTVARRQRPKSVQTFTESLKGSDNRVGDHQRHNSSCREDENTRFVNEEDKRSKSQRSDSSSHTEYKNVSFPQPKERKNNALFWIVTAAVVAIILFVVFGYVVDGEINAPSPKEENQIVQTAKITSEESNNSKPIQDLTSPKEANNIEEITSRDISINEIKYNLNMSVKAQNGILKANYTLNGDSGSETVSYNTNIPIKQILDLYEGYIYFIAASSLAWEMAPEDGSLNQEFMRPTLKLLQTSANLFSSTRGNDPTSYDGAISRYNLLKPLENKYGEEVMHEIEHISWGMGEHPVHPKYLKFN